MKQPKRMFKSQNSSIITGVILLIIFGADYGIAQKTSTAEDYLRQGDAHYKNEKYAEAIADFTKAIQTNPRNAEAYNKRGLAYQKQGIADTTGLNGDVLDLIHKDPAAFQKRMGDYTKKIENDFALAINDFTKAIKFNPQNADAYHNRALTYVGQGKNDLAVADYNKVIELNPQFPNIYLERGGIYTIRVTSDMDSAMTDFTKAIQSKPKDYYAYVGRALIYCLEGDKDRAQADEKKAVELGGAVLNKCQDKP
ncbi:MAG: tetratricopeptide repeat protein [Pyrinomonadaceae bacterium]